MWQTPDFQHREERIREFYERRSQSHKGIDETNQPAHLEIEELPAERDSLDFRENLRRQAAEHMDRIHLREREEEERDKAPAIFATIAVIALTMSGLLWNYSQSQKRAKMANRPSAVRAVEAPDDEFMRIIEAQQQTIRALEERVDFLKDQKEIRLKE